MYYIIRAAILLNWQIVLMLRFINKHIKYKNNTILRKIYVANVNNICYLRFIDNSLYHLTVRLRGY